VRSLVVMVLLTSFAAVAEAGQPRLAISGIAASEALGPTRDAVASEVRTSLETSAIFRVIRAEMVRAMQNVSPSSACYEQRCAARLGRLVQADYVVFGEIAQRGELVAVALRIVDVRDGTISHRLAFDVSPKRDELARDVDAGVRSMLGLGVKKPQSASTDPDDVELATMIRELRSVMPHETVGTKTAAVRDYSGSEAWAIEVWRARQAALN
jgi:curli biogenesis system outer membrane secretion channel CsgG